MINEEQSIHESKKVRKQADRDQIAKILNENADRDYETFLSSFSCYYDGQSQNYNQKIVNQLESLKNTDSIPDPVEYQRLINYSAINNKLLKTLQNELQNLQEEYSKLWKKGTNANE